jgi:hypothetical protein
LLENDWQLAQRSVADVRAKTATTPTLGNLVAHPVAGIALPLALLLAQHCGAL